MASNQEKIYTQYGAGFEDTRASSSRTSGLEFHYTKKAMNEFITKDSRVLEIGCATGYYAMYFADKCKEYIGVDLFSLHIDVFNKKIIENNLTNVSCQVGDATNLNGIESSGFDVVMCLGPMYHLPPEERELVFAECKRVCKAGGIIAFAYINKIGVYVGGCIHDEKYREIYPNEKANEYILRQGTDDLKPGIFYFTTPEELEEAAIRYGLSKIRNLGTDFFITMSAVDQMSDEKFELFMELADEMVSHESCTGMSNHALLICRNEGKV
ncbi:MAG: class I SAM-dependent methyltransferase [Clostridiales bacterium]|jgi:ubiquinone/menaquinone biosynthesis C-methylase UbiE|nr:class I SAM-dependent methyltransferase [Clostridiales bacterium]